MSVSLAERPLQPGDRAPNVVLDAATREGKVALDDYRGRKPVLVGLYRGLHCPFCRRHIAAMAQLDAALRDKGVETLAVVNTPPERARLYFRYHPIPNLLAASDPERISHRAFGLPNPEITESESDWPRKISMPEVLAMRVDPTGELPHPMNPIEAGDVLNAKDGYEMTADDEQMVATGPAQLVGQFLLDLDGVVRWRFVEATDGHEVFSFPTAQEMMSAASKVAA